MSIRGALFHLDCAREELGEHPRCRAVIDNIHRALMGGYDYTAPKPDDWTLGPDEPMPSEYHGTRKMQFEDDPRYQHGLGQ